jgi:hypothetical protein
LASGIADSATSFWTQMIRPEMPVVAETIKGFLKVATNAQRSLFVKQNDSQ